MGNCSSRRKRDSASNGDVSPRRPQHPCMLQTVGEKDVCDNGRSTDIHNVSGGNVHTNSGDCVNPQFDFDSVDETKLWMKTIPFVAPVTGGRVIKVYDGDTITIASKIPIKDSPLYRFSVRLNGIDTPELKGSDEIEKRVALLARDALRDRILYKDVTIINVQTEKYGRLLAEVIFNGENMNEWMITQRFAVEYNGGTKKSPDNWETYHKGN